MDKPLLSCNTDATASKSPAAPSECPINDFVELIHGNSLSSHPNALAQFLSSILLAIVPVKWPFIASISEGEGRGYIQRRLNTASPIEYSAELQGD